MQSLITGTSHTLGLVLPSVATPYSARLLSGVLHTATAAGYRVLIRETFYQLALSLAAIQMFIEQRVDGILLDCGHRALKRRMLSTRYFIDVKEMPPYEELPARDILAQLLALAPAPTAIIAWEDTIAALLCKEASSHGLRIPGDLSIMGFGNLAISSLLTPTLTTLKQHPEEVGKQAVELFLARLEGQQQASPIIPRLIAIPPALVTRASCAPPIYI